MAATLPEGSAFAVEARSSRAPFSRHSSKSFLVFPNTTKSEARSQFPQRGGGQQYKENLHNYSSLAAPHQTSVIVMATTPPPPPGPEPAYTSPLFSNISPAPQPHLDRNQQSRLRQPCGWSSKQGKQGKQSKHSKHSKQCACCPSPSSSPASVSLSHIKEDTK